MVTIQSIFFRPPLAIGRLGGAPTPMDSYIWREDPTIHGSARNIIEPALSFEVLADGSLAPFVPTVLRFREGPELRPVAPFFELWATVVYGEREHGHAPGSVGEAPVTLDLLKGVGARPADLAYGARVANRKAARRTNDRSNAFEATAQIRGDDFTRHRLLAFTPPQPGGEPLVLPDRPVPLGWLQAIRPIPAEVGAADLSVLRLRFTPGRGEVYGPPSAILGGDDATQRFYEIVPVANRILNPAASWLRYDGDYANPAWVNPEPFDTYDGADQNRSISWGVVDDTCDGVVTAELVVGGRRFTAAARIAVGPPDFAPDRRPFLSLADDLADRDLDPEAPGELLATEPDIQARLADLFQRVWETASLVNVDAIRARALRDNRGLPHSPKVDDLPVTDERSMRPADIPYADAKVRALIPDDPAEQVPLVFSTLVALAHDPLADEDALIAFLLNQPQRVRQMIRPAYAAFRQLQPEVRPDEEPNPAFRDPRIVRDLMHDTRMPPYMRDEMARALSLTRRQYTELMAYVDAASQPPAAMAGPAEPLPRTPVRRRVQRRLLRDAEAAQAAAGVGDDDATTPGGRP